MSHDRGFSAPLTIKEAVRWIEMRTGVRKSYATLFRWIRKGVGGRTLPYTCCGGTLHVMPDALAAFLEASDLHRNSRALQGSPDRRTACPQQLKVSPARRRQIAEVNERLRRRLGGK